MMDIHEQATRNEEILRLYLAGSKVGAIAERYGLGRQRITQIVQAQVRAHHKMDAIRHALDDRAVREKLQEAMNIRARAQTEIEYRVAEEKAAVETRIKSRVNAIRREMEENETLRFMDFLRKRSRTRRAMKDAIAKGYIDQASCDQMWQEEYGPSDGEVSTWH